MLIVEVILTTAVAYLIKLYSYVKHNMTHIGGLAHIYNKAISLRQSQLNTHRRLSHISNKAISLRQAQLNTHRRVSTHI